MPTKIDVNYIDLQTRLTYANEDISYDISYCIIDCIVL